MHRFSFKKEPLEICKLYPYLGTIITNNGNFKVNIQEICKSARRIMYALLVSTSRFASGQRKSAPIRILENQWYSSRVKYSQGKRRLYTTLKERPGFETYLILNNPNLRQAITKLRISAHKLSIETGPYNQKT